jgi:hypothetical protein
MVFQRNTSVVLHAGRFETVVRFVRVKEVNETGDDAGYSAARKRFSAKKSRNSLSW